MKQYLLKVWMTAALSLLVLGGVWGQTAPTVVSLSPADGAPGVSVGATLSIEFENPIIAKPTGPFSQLVIKNDETVVYTYGSGFGQFFKGFDETTDISIVGNVLTIDLPDDLLEGSTYTVEIGDGFVYDEGTNTAGVSILGPEGWSFTTESTIVIHPTIAADGLSPANGTTGVSVGATLSIEFENPIIAKPTGPFSQLVIKNDETVVYTYGSGFGQFFKGFDETTDISIVGNVLTIDLPDDLLEGSTYTVEIGDGFVYDEGTNTAGVSILGPEGWSFTTIVAAEPPGIVLSSISPVKDAIEVSRAPVISLQFDRPIQWGVEGLFRIREVTGERIATTVSPREAGASISSDSLSIEFTSPRLAYGTEYYVEITNDFVRAVDGAAPFPGLSDKTVWSFTTETAPPFWKEGYPMIANQTADDFDLLGKVDQGGTYYFVVSYEEAMLTYEDIRTAATSGGTAGGFLAAGNDVVVADNEFKATISTADLEPGFNYYLFVYTSNGDKNGEIVRLTIDRTAPKLLTRGTFPSAGYTVLPIDADIVLTFSEKIYGVEEGVLAELTTENAGSFIELVTGETSVTTGISVSADGRVFTLSPTDDLSENTSYSVEFSELSDAQFNVATIPAHTFSTDGLNEWTGQGAAGNWSDAENWSGDYAAGKSVIIPVNSLANYPVISADVEVNNLTIDAGAVLTHNGGVLTVLGEFILKSSVDVNASYINSGAKGVDIDVDGDKVRVEQRFEDVYLTYLLSSPTAKTNVANFGGYFPLSIYDNRTDTWPNVSASHSMLPGVGYRMWTYDPLVYFSGTFNVGAFKIPLTRTEGKGFGWNLVGNPYAASIDWTELNVSVNSPNIEDSFWIWLPKDQSYGAYSASTDIPINISSSIIPSNHAFLVKVKIDKETAYVNFDPSSQVPNGANYLKSSNVPSVPYMKFAGVAGTVKDEMAIAFIEEATFGLDAFDLEKRFSNQKHVFELFTHADNLQTAINAIPLDETYEMALGYNALESGSFAIEMVSDYADNVTCILVDKDLNVEQEMRLGDKYEFSVATKGKSSSRFALKFSKVATSINNVARKDLEFFVYAIDREVFVDVSGIRDGYAFQLTDSQGRVLRQGRLVDINKASIGFYERGVYVLTLIDFNGQSYGSKKVAVY